MNPSAPGQGLLSQGVGPARLARSPLAIGTPGHCAPSRGLPGLLWQIAILLWLAAGAVAVPAQDLVEIGARLQPAEGAVPGQRIRLEVTVATPRWFTAGTRIKLPEVPGLILMQNQDFAANATERRGGESWTVQRWSLDVFATRAGAITIPPLHVSVAVSQSATQTLNTTLQTQPLTVTTSIPPELETIDSWVASPSVSLSQSVEGDTDTYPGAAISRKITVKAADVMAMLLPRIETGDPPLLQSYPEPPVLRNRSNRGTLSATRSDRTTWIASTPGSSEIPGVTVHWWNTETKQLKTLSTEAIGISISGQPPELPASPRDRMELAVTAAAVLGLVLLMAACWRLGLPQRIAALWRWALGHCRRGWAVLTGAVLPEQLNPGGSSGPGRRGH